MNSNYAADQFEFIRERMAELERETIARVNAPPSPEAPMIDPPRLDDLAEAFNPIGTLGGFCDTGDCA